MAELRKVLSVGSSSFAVVLPKSWVVSNGVGKQDSLWVMPKGDGSLLIWKDVERKTKVEVDDANQLSDEILRHIVQSSYVLNVDEVELITGGRDSVQELASRVTRISRSFQGLSTRYHENSVSLACLIDSNSVNVPQIFGEIFSIFKLMFNQVAFGVLVDNELHLQELDRKYLLGVRYLIHTLRNRTSQQEKGGLDHAIQALGYRVCLKVIRSLVIHLGALQRSLAGNKAPELKGLVEPMVEVTGKAVKLIEEPDLDELIRLERKYHELLEVQGALALEGVAYRDALTSFLLNWQDAVATFMATATTRWVESRVGLIKTKSESDG